MHEQGYPSKGRALVKTGVRLALERIDPQAPAGVGER